MAPYFGAYFSYGDRYYDNYAVVYRPYSRHYADYYNPWYPSYWASYAPYGYGFGYYATPSYAPTTIYNEQPVIEREYHDTVYYYGQPDAATVAPEASPEDFPVEPDLSPPDSVEISPQGNESDFGAVREPAGQVAPGNDTGAPEDQVAGEQYQEPVTIVMGHQAFFRGDYENAGRYYFEAMMADGNDPYAKLFYAMAGFARGEYGVAMTALHGVFNSAPSLIASPVDWRQFYPDRDTLEGQLAALRAHVDKSTNETDARALLAYVCFATGEPEEALSVLGKAEPTKDGDFVGLLRESVQSVVEQMKNQPDAEANPPQDAPIP